MEMLIALGGLFLAGILAFFWGQERKKNHSLIDQLTAERSARQVLEIRAQEEARSRASDTALRREYDQALQEKLEVLGKQLLLSGTQTLRRENEHQLQVVLQPLKDQLQAFKSEIAQNKDAQIERDSALKTWIAQLSRQHEVLHSTAQQLADALRGDQKLQGDWGELALERILEMSGLQKGIEYDTQVSLKDAEGTSFRPDVVINLPENKHIIIDAKVSLKAFEQYIHAVDDEQRRTLLQAHVTSVKNHIKQLSDKNYPNLQRVQSPEFVLLFVPLEASFALAIKQEPGLYQFAWEKRVVLVTPSTLLATLKTVESIWRYERQTRNAVEIAEQAGRLYDKFVGLMDDLQLVQKKQQDAQEGLNLAMKKLQLGSGNLVTSVEKLRKLGAKAKKQLPIDSSEDGLID